MSISQRLRKEIAEYKDSRNALCVKTGLEPASISRFMAGQRGLNTASVDALCEELGLVLVRRPGGRRKVKESRK